MDPKLIFHLCQIIDQGSMSRAARTLNVTQPTLTRSIKTLEEIVGAPVLRRSRYGVTATNIGERLAEQGRHVHNSVRAADEVVQYWRSGMVGEVRLGIGSMMSAALLPDFFRANPLDESNFTMRILATDSPTAVQKLRKNELDMAIIPSYPNQTIGTLVQYPLCTDRICVLAGSNSPLAQIDGVVEAKLLPTQTWISINNMARLRHIHDEVAQLLGVDVIVPKFMFDGDVTAPMELLKHSTMLTLAPTKLARKYVESGGLKILKLDVHLPNRDIALWMTNESENDTCAMEIAKRIKNYYAQQVEVYEHALNNSDTTEVSA